jgi:DNA mismatch repair protein MutS2
MTGNELAVKLENNEKMNQTQTLDTTKVLEWDRFIELAQKEARTWLAKALIENLQQQIHWAKDIESAQLMQLETQEMTSLLERDALWGPLDELEDPLSCLDRLRKGSVLEITELALIRKWLYAVDSWIQIPRDEIRAERFKKTLSQLMDPFHLVRILDQILTPEDELNERASHQLAALYSEIRSLRREISIVLDSLMKAYSQKGILQENFSDVRDGRYVVPIKIACQNDLEGIIYEASASGQTVFVEPQEVSHLNNRLRQRQNDLIQEIFKVLEETSKQLQPFCSEMESSVIQMAHWDAVQAKARLGLHYSGKPIEVIQERNFSLSQTAHPLLWWSVPNEQIIRNDVEFGVPAKTLLLTGPNTGGKTVLLKTLGMAGLCARSGFLFPAIGFPKIPFFDTFFADLGDSQSIQQQVSSFSGHVFRFKEILEKTTAHSLILLDELNSATDPEEGAAFGRAVLETMMQKEVMIISTTHDPHLKALALSDARIVNASMAFDESSRTPTYRMLIGVPGRSRALETAERLGIPPSVIQLARSYLSQEHNTFEKLLTQLEIDAKEANQAKRDAIKIREEVEKLKREWTEKTEASVSEMMDRTRQKLRRVFEQAQDEVRASVRKLDEMRSRKELDSSRSSIQEAFSKASTQIDSALQEEAPEIAQTLFKEKKKDQRATQSDFSPTFTQGMRVRIPKWKNTGTIVDVLGSRVKVAMGTLQMTLSTNEIQPLEDSQKTPKAHVQVDIQQNFAEGGSRIDLRGLRFEDAMGQLEQYLDLNYRTKNFQEVTIVHGLGTGAIREGAHQLLKKLPYVRSFRDGGIGQGGTGATIVEFDLD